MTMDYALIICSLISMASAALVAIITMLGNTKIAKEKRLQEQEKTQRKANKEQEETIVKTINEGLKIVNEKIETIEGKIEIQKEMIIPMAKGIQAVLRDSLLQKYKCCAENNKTTLEERENFENIYEQYHSLGKNGVMDGVREDFLKLQLDPTSIKKY